MISDDGQEPEVAEVPGRTSFNSALFDPANVTVYWVGRKVGMAGYRHACPKAVPDGDPPSAAAEPQVIRSVLSESAESENLAQGAFVSVGQDNRKYSASIGSVRQDGPRRAE